MIKVIFCGLCKTISPKILYSERAGEYHSPEDCEGISVTDPSQMKTHCLSMSFLIQWEKKHLIDFNCPVILIHSSKITTSGIVAATIVVISPLFIITKIILQNLSSSFYIGQGATVHWDGMVIPVPLVTWYCCCGCFYLYFSSSSFSLLNLFFCGKNGPYSLGQGANYEIAASPKYVCSSSPFWNRKTHNPAAH